MKEKTVKKLNELIQKPLRFHHQDIHEELERLDKKLDALLEEVRKINNQGET
jgi:hypothetical protein